MTIILCSLLGKSLISFSLIWFIAISFVLVFGTYSPISSFPLTLFVDICTLNKKPAYFILIDWSHKETNLISQPGLSTWLSFKCLCLCCHCFPSGSQFLRVQQNLQCTKDIGDGHILVQAPRGLLTSNPLSSLMQASRTLTLQAAGRKIRTFYTQQSPSQEEIRSWFLIHCAEYEGIIPWSP